MKLTFTDLAAVRGALLALLLVALASAVAVAESGHFLDAAMSALDAARRSHTVAQNRLIKSGEESEIILRFRDAYAHLVQRGLIGHEDRVGWIQALTRAARERQLYSVDYSLQAQHNGLHPVSAGVPLAFRESPMRLSASLLHEDDLERFLIELAATAPGLFDVRDCTLARVPRQFNAPSNEPRLTAECNLAWLTIAPRPSSR